MKPYMMALLCLINISSLQAEIINYGHFTNTVKVEWMRGDQDERQMKLLEDFAYVDPKGKVWTAPKGYITDGASIPRVFWSLVGAPFDGQYREAAVIHDVYCDTKTEPWQDVHRIFYYANRAAGVPEIKSKLLYTAVRVGGPKWGAGRSKCFSSCHDVPADKHGKTYTLPKITETEAKNIADWVVGNNPSLDEIDIHVQQQFPNSIFGH